jgi:hypothetical protein
MDTQPIVKTSTRSPALIRAQQKYRLKKKAEGLGSTPAAKKAQTKYRKSVMYTPEYKEKYAKYSRNYYNLNKEKVSKQRKAIRDKNKNKILTKEKLIRDEIKSDAVKSQIKNISNYISKDE